MVSAFKIKRHESNQEMLLFTACKIDQRQTFSKKRKIGSKTRTAIFGDFSQSPFDPGCVRYFISHYHTLKDKGCLEGGI